jgi:hypothetical protein
MRSFPSLTWLLQFIISHLNDYSFASKVLPFTLGIPMKKMISVAMMSLLLVACGKTLDGTYKNKATGAEISFKNNKVDYMGMFSMDYKIEDGYVKMHMDGAPGVQLKIKDDNTIIMPLVGEFKKIN